ncbi:MAG TPA: alpha-1,2-fucosyltransferase [Gaiellaceae bacterium]|nr:alpha-1,2-fucosyltransferase [Gaiellaceae bacterium]
MRPAVYLTIIPSGLGNQLFQYAAGFAFAKTWSVPLKVDIGMFDNPTYTRSYALHRFALTATYATSAEHRYFSSQSVAARLRRLVDYVRSGGQHAQIGDYHAMRRLHPALQEAPPRRPVQVAGFWEVAEFARIGGRELRQELTLREPPDPENEEWLRRIDESPAVAVHVRGSDLIRHEKLHGRYVPGPEYYGPAADRMAAREPAAVFYVFSDEGAFARQSVRLPYPTVFVEHNGEERHHEDLRLFARCRHHILASSTFGWWGAWLGAREGQHVIAPKTYFVGNDPPIEEYYPPEWELL